MPNVYKIVQRIRKIASTNSYMILFFDKSSLRRQDCHYLPLDTRRIIPAIPKPHLGRFKLISQYNPESDNVGTFRRTWRLRRARILVFYMAKLRTRCKTYTNEQRTFTVWIYVCEEKNSPAPPARYSCPKSINLRFRYGAIAIEFPTPQPHMETS